MECVKYATIGDSVDVAARLESFDKDLVLSHLQQLLASFWEQLLTNGVRPFF